MRTCRIVMFTFKMAALSLNLRHQIAQLFKMNPTKAVSNKEKLNKSIGSFRIKTGCMIRRLLKRKRQS